MHRLEIDHGRSPGRPTTSRLIIESLGKAPWTSPPRLLRSAKACYKQRLISSTPLLPMNQVCHSPPFVSFLIQKRGKNLETIAHPVNYQEEHSVKLTISPIQAKYNKRHYPTFPRSTHTEKLHAPFTSKTSVYHLSSQIRQKNQTMPY